MLNPVSIGLASACLIVLIFLAVYYTVKVRQLNKRRDAQREDYNRLLKQQHDHIVKSIHVIAHATVTNQVSLTEASIRITVLLDSLGVDDTVKAEYSAFYKLADATHHIPILDEWKKLAVEKQKLFDQERIALEQQYSDFILASANRIRHDKLIP